MTFAKPQPYCIYDRFDFDIPTLPESDIFARYYIRLLEARESVKILKQALRDIPARRIFWAARTNTPSVRQKAKPTRAIEAPKGELGFYVVSDNKANPIATMCARPATST